MTTSLKTSFYWANVNATKADIYDRKCDKCDYTCRLPMSMIMHNELEHLTEIPTPSEA